MHLANVMGSSGTLISVESRAEHAKVGRNEHGKTVRGPTRIP